MSFRPERQRSGGIHHVGERTNTRYNLPLGKIPRLALLPRNDMSGGGSFLSTRVVFETYPERHIGRSLRFRWWVVTFYPSGAEGRTFWGVVPLRLLFLQWKMPYRASSTAYGGPPSPKGKVLALSLGPYR